MASHRPRQSPSADGQSGGHPSPVLVASTRSTGLSACAGIFSVQPLVTCQRSERRCPSGVRLVPPLAYSRWFDLVLRSLSNQSEANHRPPAMARKGPIQKMPLSLPCHTPSKHSHSPSRMRSGAITSPTIRRVLSVIVPLPGLTIGQAINLKSTPLER